MLLATSPKALAVIRVARTIADLAGVEAVTTEHLGEALQYRVVEKR